MITFAEALKLHVRDDPTGVFGGSVPFVSEQRMLPCERDVTTGDGRQGKARDCVIFVDRGGELFNDRVNLNEGFVQCMVRHARPNKCKEWIMSLSHGLSETSPDIIKGATPNQSRLCFVGIWLINEPSFVQMESDDSDIQIWSSTFRCLGSFLKEDTNNPGTFISATNKRG